MGRPSNLGIEWNAENKLKKVLKNAATIATFAYDPFGRRVEKVAGGTTTTFTYDGADILRKNVGATTVYYVQGPGIDAPLANEVSGTTTYYHADALGSILKITNAGGSVTHEYRYDAFGRIEAGSTQGGFSFTGREWDPEIALFYYRARYYDPAIGRFISEDPMSFAASTNLYAYASGNPTRYVDPLGLYSRDVHFYVTRQLAIEAGFNLWQAETIARGNQDMDDIWAFNPWNGRSNRVRFHFTNESRRCEMRSEAFEHKSWWAFGNYLHALQDSYAHQKGQTDREEPYGPTLGHGWTPNPDRPEERPVLYEKMLDHTRQEMKSFYQVIKNGGLADVGRF